MSISNEIQTKPSNSSRIPSQRDFEIFRMAEILGLTHERIASVCNLTRRRVSQIVEIVRDWLSNNPCEDPQLATELQRKRLAQHLERMRLEDVILRARAALDLAPTHLTTLHIKADGSEAKTVREQPPIDVQVLKTYLRAIQALGKFHQQPEVPYPPPAEGEFTWAKEAMNEVLTRWYERIWSRSLKVENFYDFGEELIGAFIKSLRLQQPSTDDTPAEAAASEGDDDEPESAVGNALCGVPRASNDDATGLGCVDLGDSEAASDSLSTEYSVPRASDSPNTEDNRNPKSEIQNRRSASVTSSASQREAHCSASALPGADGATSWAAETYKTLLSDETSPQTAPPSPENLKREAPPPSISPSFCHSVPRSTSPGSDGAALQR